MSVFWGLLVAYVFVLGLGRIGVQMRALVGLVRRGLGR